MNTLKALRLVSDPIDIHGTSVSKLKAFKSVKYYPPQAFRFHYGAYATNRYLAAYVCDDDIYPGEDMTLGSDNEWYPSEGPYTKQSFYNDAFEADWHAIRLPSMKYPSTRRKIDSEDLYLTIDGSQFSVVFLNRALKFFKTLGESGTGSCIGHAKASPVLLLESKSAKLVIMGARSN